MKTGEEFWLVAAVVLGATAYLYLREEPYASISNGGGAAPSGGGTNGFNANNPGNLRYIANNPFAGQTGQTASGFGIYDSLADGVAAMYKQLTKYYRGGKRTVAAIVSTWAPSSENNTNAYVQDVSSQMGVAPNEQLSWPEDAVPLIQAIAYHENGYNPMSAADVHAYIGA